MILKMKLIKILLQILTILHILLNEINIKKYY